MTLAEAVLLTVITAATPFLIAALGELVVERTGVLNLGVEGMMVMGAACAFAAATLSDSAIVGFAAGTLAGAVLASLFAVAVLGLATNQVATGLALTILGLGVSGLIGAPFVGAKRDPIPVLYIPGLSDLPFIGRVLFGQDAIVYLGLVLCLGVGWFLNRTRRGLTLRAIGEDHVSAHSLGLPVARVRFLAILFGGACAGLAGAYLSLVYTRFWSPGMTGGRGWIALALVVFATWRPGRVLGGAYLFGLATVLQLHAQAGAIGLPAQLLSALPYLVTIIALVILAARDPAGTGAPGSLGRPFAPDR
jgi:general nucleoside transport system permease protein